MKCDNVNHPSWYKSDVGLEVIDIIEAFNLDFYQSNMIKYIIRAGRKTKDTELDDYKKARWYLERKISRLEK